MYVGFYNLKEIYFILTSKLNRIEELFESLIVDNT